MKLKQIAIFRSANADFSCFGSGIAVSNLNEDNSPKTPVIERKTENTPYSCSSYNREIRG